MKLILKILIGLGVVAVAASEITSATFFSGPLNRATSCTLTGNSIDELDAIKSSCNDITIENLAVPAGKTLDLTGLSDVSITFKGNISFGYAEWKGPLVLISGTNINITGERGHVFDGQGARWWDNLGGNGGVRKPRFFKIRYLYNGVVNHINFLNSPRHCFAIHNCTNITVNNVVMNTKDGDTQGGHNTDAINVKGSENVFISNTTVYNQDDCLAVRSGKNIHFTLAFCSGGHGISIGSVGNRTNNVVEDVYITHSTVVNSGTGIRIKTVVNATGLVSGVTYDNITLSKIKDYGILMRGDYRNMPGPTGTPSNGIPIRNVTITNVHGTVERRGTNIYILLVEGVAQNWYWNNVNITGGTRNRTCRGVPPNSGVFCA
ncbi:polygalacturonase-like [Agrilus planipennis]|uniref:endo-polygalacturonase n=1 Tax=Agrilus planipennis TaxID=224129 RepID=A0A7F5QZ71_AGRPL|nr:polygalacturonase-like [Agrilus planipennis]XP_025830595.1 polygalacturonase-like [Agrilus planipennis]XP_025830596.1 polygalacturonase-like [Agrilus planipennis]